MSARGLAVLTALAAPGGCIPPPDPLELDPDVISIASVLVAGEEQAHLLAGHPHRAAYDRPPRVAASLVGPGWRIAFAPAGGLGGCRGGPIDLSFPKVCLRAVLPERIREETTYRLEGEGPKGSFTGETVVPPAPTLLEPGDTVWLPDSVHSIPIRYRASREVGTLRPEMFADFGSGSAWIPVDPESLDLDGRTEKVWISGYDRRRIVRASLSLLGIGWHYTNFRRLHRTRLPWPSVGVSGEGVYGYFDGSAKSRSIQVELEEDG